MTWDIFFYVRYNVLWRIHTTDDPEQVRRYEAAGCVARLRTDPPKVKR